MPSFEYTATNQAGSSEAGTVLGLSMADAVQQLADKGLKVDRINIAQFLGDPLADASVAPSSPIERPRIEVPTPPAQAPINTAPPTEARSYMATSVVGPLVGKVSLSTLMFFFRQFGTMIEAGVPMVQSLETLARQSQDPRMRNVVDEIKRHVEAGRPISAGMQRYPEIFTPLHLSLIRAGEEGGFLAGSCKQIANYLEQEGRIRDTYRKATFMPKLTVFGSIIVIGAANWFISTFTKGSTIWSPLTTLATWFILGPIVVGIFLFFRVGLANPRIRYNWDQFILKVPFLGNTLKQFAMAKFGRALGALYSGGVSVQKSLMLAADACGNEYLRAKIQPAVKTLETGAGITETLRNTDAFTPMVVDMIHTGETTGNLDQMLTKVSEFYEDEAEVRSIQLGRVCGAAAIVAVGIYVLIVLVKFYGGYFNGMMDAAGSD